MMHANEIFGTCDGQQVQAITLSNASGMRARLITYGARLTELHAPDRDGRLADIVLGYDTLQEYIESDTYFGATCGRYGNRIAKARFTLDGVEYRLDTNEGANHLHGGSGGFDRKIWTVAQQSDASVTFAAVSEDGEMGFPGRCNLATRYDLTDDNRLIITMTADTTRPTMINMVHHSYFNLAGQGSGDILAQELKIAGGFYTPVDAENIATGEIRSVTGTPFDFTAQKPIGQNFAALKTEGFDHNWCLDAGPALREAMEAYDPASGRRMSLRTTEPGLQIYTGGYLGTNDKGKGGAALCKYAGFAAETQKFPCSPNFDHFPDCRLDPGERYQHQMQFHFSTDPAEH